MLEALRAALPAVTAFVTGQLVGRLQSGDAFVGVLAVLGLALFANQVVGAVLGPVRDTAVHRIDGENRRRVMTLTTGTDDVGRLDSPDVQDIVRRAAGEPSNWTEKTPGDGAAGQLTMVFRYFGLVSSAAVLASYAWWLVPIAVLPAIVVRVVTQRQWIGINRVWAAGVGESRRSDYWGELTSSPAEAREMRVFGFGDWAVARNQRHRLNHFEPVWQAGERAVGRQVVQFLFTAAALIGLFAAAGLEALDRGDSLGLLAAALAAGWSAFGAMAGNADAFAVEGALPAVRAHQRLVEVLGEPAVAEALPVVRPDKPPLVRFENVSFRYPGADEDVLRDMNLEIRPGEVLAVVGVNGAGKTTLIKLLTGLYQPGAGRITADGADIADLGGSVWRHTLAVAFQDFIHYRFSVRDNIAFGRADHLHDDEAVGKAVRDAGLAPLLDRLPRGLATPLTRSTDGGVDLSGGQWQQIALARVLFALHTGARVLVLDEPTAHLDVRTEFQLFRQLIHTAREASVVLISHRLSTVREADRIVLLDNGRITESGSHDELIRAGGLYAEMFEIQARRFQRTSDGGPR